MFCGGVSRVEQLFLLREGSVLYLGNFVGAMSKVVSVLFW